MADIIKYPYSDEYMTFNEESRRYVLTLKYCEEKLGVDLMSALAERKGINPQILANHFLEEVSDDIYSFIHSHSLYTDYQDNLIATVPSLRGIVQKALGQQFLYSRLNGLLGYSAETEKQQNRICPKAQGTLSQIVPELGRSILYTGVC